ncbi:Cell growth-regulating nucleolar protein [Handroanthus impetiginosus]|uniref:Cell growth-regulating nucleolar protein n=1 Tax=Handroanthus impetiginosus TaxID=429701 RepID=A0A2G9FZS3_9LAMI|nr:Cell growth-regulating nucleolar protein [Handroanthus impetiginosus]
MVWFQCEDCGDNLKKPKLPNHFRVCSAYKLSCIDCGQVFGQQDVESHTQCITEAEKYGPKGQGKASNGTNTKPKNHSKQKPEVDINVGLSDRPPWLCSLCNTKATSKQTLLLHADGKKHRAKARAFHAAKQQPNGTPETKGETENNAKGEVVQDKDLGKSGDENSSKVVPLPNDSDAEKNSLESSKKRKLEASENDGAQHKTGGGISAELGNGEVIQIKGAETEVTKSLKKAKHSTTQEDAKLDSTPDKASGKKKTKWKKLIMTALKSDPDGALKFKKLRKVVIKSLKESGFSEDKNQVSKMLEQKINSSSRFIVDGKYVRMATGS